MIWLLASWMNTFPIWKQNMENWENFHQKLVSMLPRISISIKYLSIRQEKESRHVSISV